MDVEQFSGTLNWGSDFDANPWDLSYADADIAVRFFPKPNVQIPVSFMQMGGMRGYQVGAEIDYDLEPGKMTTARTMLHLQKPFGPPVSFPSLLRRLGHIFPQAVFTHNVVKLMGPHRVAATVQYRQRLHTRVDWSRRFFGELAQVALSLIDAGLARPAASAALTVGPVRLDAGAGPGRSWAATTLHGQLPAWRAAQKHLAARLAQLGAGDTALPDDEPVPQYPAPPPLADVLVAARAARRGSWGVVAMAVVRVLSRVLRFLLDVQWATVGATLRAYSGRSWRQWRAHLARLALLQLLQLAGGPHVSVRCEWRRVGGRARASLPVRVAWHSDTVQCGLACDPLRRWVALWLGVGSWLQQWGWGPGWLAADEADRMRAAPVAQGLYELREGGWWSTRAGWPGWDDAL